MFTDSALYSVLCVGHILKKLLIFLIMDIMSLYQAGLSPWIDLVFPALFVCKMNSNLVYIKQSEED